MPSPQHLSDTDYMKIALELARSSSCMGEVPIGSVLIDREGTIIASAGNNCIAAVDPVGHAEIRTLRMAAKKIGNYRLPDTTLYVTLEPCVMCTAALINARVARVVYGADDPKAGGIAGVYRINQDRKLNHYFEVTSGVLAEECGEILRDFFRRRRKNHFSIVKKPNTV